MPNIIINTTSCSGITAFLRSISSEAIGLGVHLAAGAHDLLLQAEYMVANPTTQSMPSRMQTNVRTNQPRDAQHGIQQVNNHQRTLIGCSSYIHIYFNYVFFSYIFQARESLSNGLETSAIALVQRPLRKFLRGDGAGSALVAAVRAVPTAAIAPASACAGAMHYALLGFRNRFVF